MPGVTEESTGSENKSKRRPHLGRRPIHGLGNGQNSDPKVEDASLSEEGDDVDEVGKQHEPGARGGEAEEVVEPSRLYPEIPKSVDFKNEPKASRESTLNSVFPSQWHFIYLLLLFVGAVTVYFYFFKKNESPPPNWDVDAVVSTLRRDFGYLHEDNFKILKSALHRVTAASEPKAPAVLLLVSAADNAHSSALLAGRLSSALSKSFFTLSGTDLSTREDAKKYIDDTIRDAVDSKNTNVFLISELHRLTLDSALMLHSFCDDEHALYKRVAYVVTVSCAALNATEKWDKIGEDCLKQSWPNASDNKITSFVNRLTHSVLIL